MFLLNFSFIFKEKHRNVYYNIVLYHCTLDLYKHNKNKQVIRRETFQFENTVSTSETIGSICENR